MAIGASSGGAEIASQSFSFFTGAFATVSEEAAIEVAEVSLVPEPSMEPPVSSTTMGAY